MSSGAPLDPARMNRLLRHGLIYADSNPITTPETNPTDLIADAALTTSVEVLRYMSKVDAGPDDIRAALARDLAPIPNSTNREGYASGRDLSYWISGYAEYKMIERIARKYGISSGRYLDFGGSTGRVFRHFLYQATGWDIWTCDFKPSSVEFNLNYFPSEVRAFLNTSFPFLPLPDSYFDVISACSVFTHLNEPETGWLLELRRIMRVGAVAYITILGEEAWRDDKMLKGVVEKFRPDLAAVPELPPGKNVIMFRQDDPYYCTVAHSRGYIQKNWGRYFEICEIRPPYLLNQSTVVCRRTD